MKIKASHESDTHHDYVTLYTTFPDAESAETAAMTLVGEELVACANLLPKVTSIYRWQGKIEKESEVAILMKTRKGRAEAVIQRLAQLHPYEVPCIVTWPIDQGHSPYLDWIDKHTAT